VTILRLLARRRVIVGLSGLAAIAIGVALAYGVTLAPPGLGSREQPAAHATTRVLVDMPSSLLVNTPGNRADTTATRGLLLADLALSDPVKATIARSAGIEPGQLRIITPSLSDAPRPNVLTDRTVAAAKAAGVPYVLRLDADGRLPIVWVDATAPSAASAKRLAAAATAGLRSVAGEGEDRVVVDQLAAPQAEPGPAGSESVRAVLAAAFIFCLLCGCIVVAAGLSARRRAA